MRHSALLLTFCGLGLVLLGLWCLLGGSTGIILYYFYGGTVIPPFSIMMFLLGAVCLHAGIFTMNKIAPKLSGGGIKIFFGGLITASGIFLEYMIFYWPEMVRVPHGGLLLPGLLGGIALLLGICVLLTPRKHLAPTN